MLVICAFSTALAQPSFAVRFDRERYDINPGETFAAQLLIDPVPTSGLFSFGVTVKFDATHSQVADASGITPVAPLDFNGVKGSGAIKSVAVDHAAAKGTVDFFQQPKEASQSALLATFLITDKSPGPYQLSAEFFNTLGPSEEIFVDGAGNVLDPQLTFGTALVNYRPQVSLTSPADQEVFPLLTTILLAATANDLDGSIAKVEFFDGQSKIGESTGPVFEFNWTSATGPRQRLARTHSQPSLPTTLADSHICSRPYSGQDLKRPTHSCCDRGQKRG